MAPLYRLREARSSLLVSSVRVSPTQQPVGVFYTSWRFMRSTKLPDKVSGRSQDTGSCSHTILGIHTVPYVHLTHAEVRGVSWTAARDTSFCVDTHTSPFRFASYLSPFYLYCKDHVQLYVARWEQSPAQTGARVIWQNRFVCRCTLTFHQSFVFPSLWRK